MIVDDALDVDAPIDRVWGVITDIPRVAGCIPNAQIIETVDDRTYRAKVTVKVGPVSVAYNATISVESLDEATHTARIRVQGDDVKGRGGVRAAIVSQLESRDGKTHVSLHADAQISGVIASVGGRLIEGVAKKTVDEFARRLQQLL